VQGCDPWHCFRPKLVHYALPKFVGGGSCEGQGGNLLRFDASFLDEVTDASGEHAGLSGAGAGK